MASYVAAKRIRCGNRVLEVGDPVPSEEPGRNYKMMLRLGQITVAEERRGPGRPRKLVED